VVEGTEPATSADLRVIKVPSDPVELEARLVALERRLDELQRRDQSLLDVIEAVQRLVGAIGPLVAEAATDEPEQPPSARPRWPVPDPASGSASAPGSHLASDRLARAHERLRATLFADTQGDAAIAAAGPPATPEPPPAEPPPPAAEPPAASEPPPAEPPPAPAATALDAPLGRRPWLLSALKRMVREDPTAAGRLLLALLPAHVLAEVAPPAQTPWPPATVARLVVAGRVRRRIGWERADLAFGRPALNDLARIARLRATPAQLDAVGVRLDAYLAFALVAFAIRSAWTRGHRFVIAHLDAGPTADGGAPVATYLTIRDGSRPAVGTDTPPIPIAVTLDCAGEELLAALGAPPTEVRFSGQRPALNLVRGWFARATGT
jgi:hypothetical protein